MCSQELLSGRIPGLPIEPDCSHFFSNYLSDRPLKLLTGPLVTYLKKSKELAMSDNLPLPLAHRLKWWWDPIDMEIFKELEENAQRQIIAISLQTQAQVLKTQAEGMEKIAGAIANIR